MTYLGHPVMKQLLESSNGPKYLCQKVWKWMQAKLVIFSISIPKNVVCFKKLKQTTISSHQIGRYLKYDWI